MVSSKSPSVMRYKIVSPQGFWKKSNSTSDRVRRQQRGRVVALPQDRNPIRKVLQLFLVDGLLQFDAGSKLGHAPGGNFDDAAGLRIAPVPRLALRNREAP